MDARTRRQRIAHRGLGLIVLVSLALGATACIFDQGTKYQGGGRVDHAATAKEVGSTSSSSSGGSDDDDDGTTILPPDLDGGLGSLG